MSASDNTAAMPLILLGWKSVVKGSLRGFARVQLGVLTVNDVSVLTSHGKSWAGLPGKPQIGADGTVMRDHLGKVKYTPILEWSTREAGERFSRGVVQAVEREHGLAALDASPAPEAA